MTSETAESTPTADSMDSGMSWLHATYSYLLAMASSNSLPNIARSTRQAPRQCSPAPRCPPRLRRPVTPTPPSQDLSPVRFASPLSRRRLNPRGRPCLSTPNRSNHIPIPRSRKVMKKTYDRSPRACRNPSSRSHDCGTFPSIQCLFPLHEYVLHSLTCPSLSQTPAVRGHIELTVITQRYLVISKPAGAFT